MVGFQKQGGLDADLMFACMHESGHAVCAKLLGIPVQDAGVRPSQEGDQRWKGFVNVLCPDIPQQAICCYVSGSAAEIISGRPESVALNCADTRHAVESAMVHFRMGKAAALKVASAIRSLVICRMRRSDAWDATEAIASTLYAARSLSEPELNRLLDDYCCIDNEFIHLVQGLPNDRVPE